MCDFCHKTPEDEFEYRKKPIRKIINKYNADLIALQEVRTSYQLKYFTQDLKNRKLIYKSFGPLSFPDPAIIVNTKKYKILSENFYWLGPREGDFSFGWKWSVPRQLIWVKLQEIQTGEKFIFATTHFDNRNENLLGSAQAVQKLFSDKQIPVIFSGDTNLPIEYETYKVLTKNTFQNSFDISSTEKFNSIPGKDLCYKRKGKKFPACRVDHILLSNKHTWKSEKFIIDLEKFNGRFPSDHRAVINDISLKVLK